MHMVSTELLLARSFFARSIKVLEWQSGSPKIPGARFSEKKCPNFFEIHRTSDTSRGSVAPGNHAYRLHKITTSQSNFYKVN